MFSRFTAGKSLLSKVFQPSKQFGQLHLERSNILSSLDIRFISVKRQRGKKMKKHKHRKRLKKNRHKTRL